MESAPSMTLAGAPRQSAEAPTAGHGHARSGTSRVRVAVVARDHLKGALAGVRQNQGSPGSEGITPEERVPYLGEHGARMRAELLAGPYRPQAVKGVEISKKGGGIRYPGIPTGRDRFLPQALWQVLQPRFAPPCSEHSYGLRPGRRAQQASARAQA